MKVQFLNYNFDNNINDCEFSVKQSAINIDQDMIQVKEFQSFIHNNDTKDELIKRFMDYVQQQQTGNT